MRLCTMPVLFGSPVMSLRFFLLQLKIFNSALLSLPLFRLVTLPSSDARPILSRLSAPSAPSAVMHQVSSSGNKHCRYLLRRKVPVWLRMGKRQEAASYDVLQPHWLPALGPFQKQATTLIGMYGDTRGVRSENGKGYRVQSRRIQQ